jgi:hypothetical protein
VLDQRRDIREDQVRRRRARDNKIDIRHVDARIVDRDLRRLDAHIGSRLVFFNDVAALDTGTGSNPLISRVDDLLQIEVRHDTFRQVATRPDYARIRHADSSSSSCRIWVGS